jgi:hypothetical protein
MRRPSSWVRQGAAASAVEWASKSLQPAIARPRGRDTSRDRRAWMSGQSRAGLSRQLIEQSHHLSPSIRVHRQEVDDVGPVLTVLVAVAHQVRGDQTSPHLSAPGAQADWETFGTSVRTDNDGDASGLRSEEAAAERCPGALRVARTRLDLNRALPLIKRGGAIDRDAREVQGVQAREGIWHGHRNERARSDADALLVEKIPLGGAGSGGSEHVWRCRREPNSAEHNRADSVFRTGI